jgi:site-specific DNA-cytosine methylase
MGLFTKTNNNLSLKYIDLFCGIGGFRLATELQSFAKKEIIQKFSHLNYGKQK